MQEQRYLVAARKYRPQLFRELVAQEHVTETLKNALRLNRLGHAYLFSGPRGVGKTTAARLLAKAINCQTPLEEREDRAEPCRRCEACVAFEEGRSLNVFEIDAASNNKVEDVRELRETVRVPPQGARKKVYIIDEVHMLSNAAFNALLKTLEEPPPHALFIFATTEPHKVLPTILSRCQRFDFRRIPVEAIVARLREICAAEGVEADDESLMLLARKGDGALRDALSAFDQAVSLCGTTLRYAELAQALGVVDLDLYFAVTDHVRTGNGAGMLAVVEQVVRSGYDLQEFAIGLAEHLRNLLVARTMPDLSLIEAGEATRRRYAEAARAFEEADLLRLLGLVADLESRLKSSAQPRLQLELTLLRMASLPHAVDLRRALDLLERLAKTSPPRTDSGGSPPSRTASGPAVRSTPAASKPARPEAPESRPHTTSEMSSVFGPPALETLKRNRPEGSGGQAALATAEATDVLVAESPAELLVALQDRWPEFVRRVAQVRRHVGMVLEDTRPESIEGTTLWVDVRDPAYARLLQNQASFLLQQLCAFIEEAQQLTALRFRSPKPASEAPAQAAPPAPEPEDPALVLERLRRTSPVVQKLIDQFGCELYWGNGQ
ncbi:DNA polymerase III, subunits gamma and tau [Rhodothermus marinus SG0.5JP17-172]|uniref:DNA polymerase III subunit gamma/tau n=1 Tax=Rhodothermus marinus TaxID=29549 RepID=UPI000223DE6B|nr:DNA polymerase III subunit gamma/tau [Rhodothermus marinus]AEN74510.1 DNA polymerase III, subunits gamma and tau [Rhodothermus marinus SG0.5JP17-172]MBO2491903.1 DNA polymerase III subunit gamma/tau [Rhodothermus marinus]